MIKKIGENYFNEYLLMGWSEVIILLLLPPISKYLLNLFKFSPIFLHVNTLKINSVSFFPAQIYVTSKSFERITFLNNKPFEKFTMIFLTI